MRGFAIAIMALCAGPAIAAAQDGASQQGAAQKLSGVWDRGATAGTPFRPRDGLLGPVMRIQGRDVEGTQLGDYNAPILQPWAAAIVKKRTDNDAAGIFQAEAKETCSPMGVPHVLQLNGPIMLLIGQDVAVITYMRAMQARIIHMNKPHPTDLKTSYYGHSVGHWDGDTLVVDTIGFNDKTPVDMFGTPHTERLHVVERYHLIEGGKTLRADFTVEDPGAFTTQWASFADYGTPRAPYEPELVCAENNRMPDGSLVPGPIDTTPDF